MLSIEIAYTQSAVIASEAKQSRKRLLRRFAPLDELKPEGLLRFARNDGESSSQIGDWAAV